MRSEKTSAPGARLHGEALGCYELRIAAIEWADRRTG